MKPFFAIMGVCDENVCATLLLCAADKAGMWMFFFFFGHQLFFFFSETKAQTLQCVRQLFAIIRAVTCCPFDLQTKQPIVDS